MLSKNIDPQVEQEVFKKKILLKNQPDLATQRRGRKSL